MKNAALKLQVGTLLVIGTVLGYATGGWATVDTGTVTAMTAAGTDVKDTAVAVAIAIVPFAAVLLAIAVGWRIVRKFVH